jgi:Putative restriction endonuclease
VEVADSSLAEDRAYAVNLYGPAGIPVYWIVDVRGRRVEVYTRSGPQGYGPPAIFAEGQSVPVLIDGREVGRIAVAAILPPHRARAEAEGNGA